MRYRRRPRSRIDLGWQARDAGVVRGGFAGLLDELVDLGPGLGHDLLDTAGVDAAVLDQLGEGDAGDLPADRVEATDEHRLRGVVDDEVDARGQLQGADIAPLTADDAALHLVRRDGHDRHGHLRGMVHHDPLDGGHDHVACPLLGRLTRGSLDRTREPHGIVLCLVPHLLQQGRLGLVDGHLADLLQGHDLLLACAAEFLPLALEFLLLDQQLSVALLQHVRALIELLVPLQQPTLQVAEVGPLGAAFLLQLPLEADLFLLRLEDEVLLLGARLRNDAACLVLRGLDGLVRDDAARHEANGQASGDRGQDDHDGDDIVHGVPPVRTGHPEAHIHARHAAASPMRR